MPRAAMVPWLQNAARIVIAAWGAAAAENFFVLQQYAYAVGRSKILSALRWSASIALCIVDRICCSCPDPRGVRALGVAAASLAGAACAGHIRSLLWSVPCVA